MVEDSKLYDEDDDGRRTIEDDVVGEGGPDIMPEVTDAGSVVI